MSLKFQYTFPAIKGLQAGREYFTIMCPLSILQKLFIFDDNHYLPPNERSQRVINRNRIPDISEYIINNPTEYVFSSLTASIDGEFEFTPFDLEQHKNIGTLSISMDSKLLINDGQHRKFAIQEALQAIPDLGKETISVVLFVDEKLKRSQQIFSDLNKHAVNVSKSIGILYDSRDPVAIITKDLVYSNKNLHRYTDLENSSLSKNSNKVFTLSNFYNANEKIIGDQEVNKKLIQFINEYWKFLTDNFYEWQLVFTKELSAHKLREQSVSSFGTILEAFGLIGYEVSKSPKMNWKEKLQNINSINWSRDNFDDWKYRAISPQGNIIKNTRCIRLTAIFIKLQLGFALSDEEAEIENKFQKEK